MGFSSCQESGQDELKEGLETMLKDQDPIAYENKLKELTLFMGEVFKDPEARRELFDLAKSDEYEEDISYSLKTLLETNQNPNTRQRSAIVQAFYKNAENHRVAQEEDFNEQELIHFINENEICMLAPYMIGYFEPESLTELTVSWWTEEMELEGLTQDPNWKGKTPGFKLNINDEDNFIQFRKSEANYFSNEMIYADDDYALDNPTVVFGSFGDDASLNPGDGGIIGGTNPPNPPSSNFVNHASCDDLTQNSIVRLTMPKFRLTSSIRSWPHPDAISVSVILGTNPGGSAYTYRPFHRVKVTRWHAQNDAWITTPASFIVNNWLERQVDLAFVVWNKRPSRSQTFTGTVTIKDGELTSTQTLTVGNWSMTQRHADTYFNRCGTILNPFRDKGFGRESHVGVMYGIEKLGNFEFILVPEITL